MHVAVKWICVTCSGCEGVNMNMHAGMYASVHVGLEGEEGGDPEGMMGANQLKGQWEPFKKMISFPKIVSSIRGYGKVM